MKWFSILPESLSLQIDRELPLLSASVQSAPVFVVSGSAGSNKVNHSNGMNADTAVMNVVSADTLDIGGNNGIAAGQTDANATVSKRDFSGMGKWLFAGVLVILVAAMANIFLQLPALYLAISVIAIAIFSAYILYDVQQIINGGETNYISATLRIYLDVYNIFVNLLSLLGIFGGSRD